VSLRAWQVPPAVRNSALLLRLRDRRLADALIELATLALDSGSLPEEGGRAPQLQVTTTLETLMGLAGAPAGAPAAVSAGRVRYLAGGSSAE